jgi:D-alanine-D-alanine ligase
VLFGGRSAEHEISLLSARFVVEALDRERFEPVLVGIDKSGRWLLQNEALLLGASRDPRLQRLNQAAPSVSLPAHPAAEGGAELVVGEHGAAAIDVVFPVLHGPMGEDGSVQGLLELAGIPYVGAGVLGSAVGMDKDVMKRLLVGARLPVVPYRAFRRVDWEKRRTLCLAALTELGLPVFVKPANLGSSVGIRRVTQATELAPAVEYALAFDTKFVAEEAVKGAREIECAVLGNDEPIASVPGEIRVDHADGFYSYAAKYIDERGATLRIPADLSAERAGAVRELAVRAFEALDCAGMARVDFFLSATDELYVNEINTIPGFTAISMYPKLWEATGVSPRELVTKLIELALERAGRRSRLKTTVDEG